MAALLRSCRRAFELFETPDTIEEYFTMKTLFLASALALSVGTSAAFASVTIYSDGTIYDSAAPAASANKYAANTSAVRSDATAWHKTDGVKVVRWGPPESGLGGG